MTRAKPSPLFTIGYEKATSPAVLDELFRIYEQHLATPPAQQQLDELVALRSTPA